MKHPRQHKWKTTHPKQVWAHQCLRSALNRGLVIGAKCETCGDLDTEAHHDDYDKPMVVRWLCRPCHKAEHKRLKAEGGAK